MASGLEQRGYVACALTRPRTVGKAANLSRTQQPHFIYPMHSLHPHPESYLYKSHIQHVTWFLLTIHARLSPPSPITTTNYIPYSNSTPFYTCQRPRNWFLCKKKTVPVVKTVSKQSLISSWSTAIKSLLWMSSVHKLQQRRM